MKVRVCFGAIRKERVFEGHPAMVARQLAVRLRWLGKDTVRRRIEHVVAAINDEPGYSAEVVDEREGALTLDE